jgi:uncharacterized repeat protein (TIGR01451 family)
MNVKKIILVLLWLCSITALHAQQPVLTAPGGTQHPSNTAFNLDLQFTIPNAPCNARVAAVLTVNPNGSGITSQQIFVQGGVYGSQQLFSTSPFPFTNFTAATNTVAAQTGSTNMAFVINTLPGVICNGARPVFSAELFFFTADGKPCDTLASNRVEITITAQNKWTIDNRNVTDPLALCIGRPVIYQVDVNHPANISGSYNLTGTSITYTVPAGAQVLNVLNNSSTPIPFTITATGAVFNTGNYTVSTGSMLSSFFVIVLYPCGSVFNNGANITTNAAYNGLTPCGNNATQAEPETIIFTLPPCCNGGHVPLFIKEKWTNDVLFCPGGCRQPSVYRIRFNNAAFPTAYPQLTITDNIPANVIVSQISTQVPNGSTCILNYTLQPGGNFNINVSTGSVQVNTLPGFTPGAILTSVRWVYANVPGFSSITNELWFTLSANAQLGSVITNTTTAVSANPPLNLTAQHQSTVSQCQAGPDIRKEIFNPATNTCADNITAVPGDEVIYRLVLSNNGNAAVQAGEIIDNLNSNLSLSGGINSVRYLYSGTSCPQSGAMQPPPFTLPGSALPITFTQTGQQLRWNNVNLPLVCSGQPQQWLVIEFRVRVNNGTPSGPIPNQYTLSSPRPLPILTTIPSSVATINVVDFLNITNRMEVACPNGNYVTHLSVRPGDAIRYRITVTNTGNIAVRNTRVFNVRPQVNDITSCCPQLPRGSQFGVSYTSLNAPAVFAQQFYNQQNCNGIICNGAPCVPAGGIATAQSLALVAGNNNVLQPGQSYVIEINGTAGNGLLGQAALNDAGVSAIRVDNSQPITAVCSSLPQVIIDTTGCSIDTCSCGEWQYVQASYIRYINGEPVWVTVPLNCGDTLPDGMKHGDTYNFNYSYFCNGDSCRPSYFVQSDLPGIAYSYSTLAGGIFNVKIRADRQYCGWHYFKVTPICAGDTCEPCYIYFYINCSECADIVRDTVFCDANGNPVYQFCVRNNADFIAKVVRIKIPAGVTVLGGSVTNGTAAAGVVMGYYDFTIPGGIAPGVTHCTFRMTLGGNITPGQQVCFGLLQHDNSVPFPKCCEDSAYRRCITIPDCRHKCADILNASLNCRAGQTTLTLSVRNNGLAEMDAFVIQHIANGTASNWFTQTVSPPKTPGEVAGPYTYNLPISPLPGTTLCFRVIIYDLHMLAGVLCVKDSCIGDTVCLRAPDCRGKGEGGGGSDLRRTNPNTATETTLGGFTVFPNPVKSQLTVQSAPGGRIEFITITDTRGVRVKTVRFNHAVSATVDMKGLPAGLYVIQVNNNHTLKVMKE